MKTYPLILVALSVAVACQSQPTLQPRLQPLPPPALPSPGAPLAAAPAKVRANYLIHVEWQEPKGDLKLLEVLTTEGRFELDTIQKATVKINNNDIPTTLKFSGTLTAFDDEKGSLQLFLGRTVPYVTGSYNTGGGVSSSYSQLSVGLDSTFMVRFGKAVVVQNDDSGQVTVLVKRVEI